MNIDQNYHLLTSLLAHPVETEWLELKAARKNFSEDDFGKYVTALANGAALANEPFGYLVLGVDDKTHAIVGSLVLSSEKLKNEAKLSLYNYAKPQVQVEFLDVETESGKIVRIVKVAQPTTAISWKGHYYGRSGESITALSIEKIEQISVLRDWSAQPCPGATLANLSPEAVTKGREEFKSRHPSLASDVNEWTDEEFLSKLRVLVRGKLSNAAILLFGKQESESLLSPETSRISWYLVDEDGTPESYEHFSCPLILNSDKALERIRNKKITHLPSGTMFPEELFQYDPWTLREALANAIAHQDYTKCEHIVIKESSQGEYVSISNAGRFIPGSLENILQTFEPSRYVRNRTLVNAMIMVKMMENAHSGIRKMFKVQRDRFFPLPEYSISERGVTVILSGKLLEPEMLELFSGYKSLPLYDLYLLNKLRLCGARVLTREQISHLRERRLISGRAPYRLEGLKPEEDFCREHYFSEDTRLMDVIKVFLEEKGELGATKSEILAAVEGTFSNRLSQEQREHKVKNLLQEMRKNKVITLGPKRAWKLLFA